MRLKMKVGRMLRRIGYWWKDLSPGKKKRLFLAIIFLLIGGIFGGVIGNKIGKNVAQKEYKKESQKAENQYQAEKDLLEQKVAKLQTQLHQEQNGPTIADLPWNLTLVNEDYPMEKNYVPKLEEIEPGYSVDKRIAKPLKEMLRAAEEQGLNIIFCSAYRSVERQEQVFNESMQDRIDAGMNYWEAYDETSQSVAIPGTSEHGLGLAVDLISNQYTELDDEQANTPEAKWLKENCYRYGFILRYPPEKTEETGIIFEPWHYRYVGVEDAAKIMEQGVTLETYLRDYQ